MAKRNSKKDKIQIKFWLTETEERVLKGYVTSKMYYCIGILLKDAIERNDFKIQKPKCQA